MCHLQMALQCFSYKKINQSIASQEKIKFFLHNKKQSIPMNINDFAELLICSVSFVFPFLQKFN